jgi:hypothetical protein
LKKKEDKYKSTFRKEVMSDLKRNRHDAALQVIQYFDDEQESLDLFQSSSASASFVTNSLQLDSYSEESVIDDFFSQLPTLKEQLELDSDLDSTRLIDVVSCLHSMKSLLHISSQNYSLDYFNEQILGNPMKRKNKKNFGREEIEVKRHAPPSHVEESSKSCDDMEIVNGHSLVPLPTSVVDQQQLMIMNNEKKREEGEEEYEFDESPVVKKSSSPSERDEVELDRIQLNLIRVVLDDLHSLFGLQDRDEKKQTSSFPRFPLNQLTWPEIARMIIIASLGKDIMRTDDEVSSLPLVFSLLDYLISFLYSQDCESVEREQTVTFQTSKEYCSFNSKQNGTSPYFGKRIET